MMLHRLGREMHEKGTHMLMHTSAEIASWSVSFLGLKIMSNILWESVFHV